MIDLSPDTQRLVAVGGGAVLILFIFFFLQWMSRSVNPRQRVTTTFDRMSMRFAIASLGILLLIFLHKYGAWR